MRLRKYPISKKLESQDIEMYSQDERKPPNERFLQITYLLFNFVATVAVTFINKICFARVKFGFPAALCNIHFAMTWLGVEIMRQMGVFEPLAKTPSLRDPQFLTIVLVVGNFLYHLKYEH